MLLISCDQFTHDFCEQEASNAKQLIGQYENSSEGIYVEFKLKVNGEIGLVLDSPSSEVKDFKVCKTPRGYVVNAGKDTGCFTLKEIARI